MRSDTLTIQLTLGPTDNRRVTVMRGHLGPTREYANWQKVVVREAWAQLPAGWEPLTASEDDQLPYIVSVFLKDRRSDAANYDKCLRDVLTHAGVWQDDKWAFPQFAPAQVNPTRPRIEITLPLTAAARLRFWPHQIGNG